MIDEADILVFDFQVVVVTIYVQQPFGYKAKDTFLVGVLRNSKMLFDI